MKRMACPQIILYVLISSSLICCWISPWVFLSKGLGLLSKFIFCFLIWFFVFGIESIVYRHFFHRITIDENGCSNKYTHFEWNPIPNYKIVTLQIGVIPKWVDLEILCIGNDIDPHLNKLRPKNTVFFVLDAKTQKMIELFAKDFWTSPEK